MPQKEKKRLYFILNKKYLSNNFFRDSKNIFTLNKFILTDEESRSINHYYPNPYKTATKASALFKKTIQTKNEIIENFSKFIFPNGREDLSELLDTFLEIKLSSYFYLSSVIPLFEEYVLINKNQTLKFKSKIKLILAIEKISSQSKKGSIYFSNKFSKLKEYKYSSLFLKIQKIFLNKIAEKKKDKKIIFLSCKKAYFQNYLSFKFKENNDFVIYYHSTANFFRIIQILLDQGFKYIFRKEFNEIGMILIPLGKRLNKKIHKNYLTKLKCSLLDTNYEEKLREEINIYLSNHRFFKDYLNDCMKEIKINDAYFHTMRMPDFFTFSRILTNLKSKVYLISHGTHTIQKKGWIDNAASQILGLGLCYTNENKITLLSQSIYCDEFLGSLNKNYKKINFINNKKVKTNNYASKDKSEKTKILYIGTVKPLGIKRYYYESSSEFIGSIYEIYSKLKFFNKKFIIYINIRDVNNEINDDVLQNSFKPLNDLVIVRRNLPIANEIENSDCVISYCSTVLEEALEKNKPVMCYGLPKYNHFENYEKRNNNKKLKVNKNLKIIEEQLNRKFIHNLNIKRDLYISF